MMDKQETTNKMTAVIDVQHDELRGLLSVEHDGSITWDELQSIKDQYFGSEAVAIEVYPPNSLVVNSLPMRHLWKLGSKDWWPDLTGQKPADDLSLKERDLLMRVEMGKIDFDDRYAETTSTIRKGARRSDHRFKL